jgi:alpha-beta hydrolase superfamily lysophospholipase
VVAACAHTPDLPLRLDPSPPAGSTTDVFVARDGTQLLARTWAAPDAKAVVVIEHGLKDHSDRYAAFAAKLVAAGYEVYAYDLRGHGRSAGPRVAPDSWFDYADDLDRFITRVETREPGKKLFVFGHSMGGAIATLVAERHRPTIAGLILSGPALAVDAPPILVAATTMAGALTPDSPALVLDNREFSSDPANAVAMDHDPLISQPPGPARTVAGLVDGIHEIWRGVDQLTMPLLALHGSADKLTAPSGSRMLVLAAASADKTLHIYDGSFHDLLHEPKHVEVEDDMIAWLGAHTGGPPIPATPIYPGHLAGDPKHFVQVVQSSGGVAFAGNTKFAGAFGMNIVDGRRIGYEFTFTGRLAGRYKTLSLRPVGVALRAGDTTLGLSIGASLVTGTAVAYSGGAWLARPAGPVHVELLAEYARRVRDATGDAPAGADLLWTGLSLRLGRDRHFWPGMRAGFGPVVDAGFDWLEGERGVSITVGLALYGAD